MKTYSHTQRAGRWLLFPAVMAVLLAGFAASTRVWGALSGIPVLVAVAWLFGSISVEVADRQLHWRFGPGLIRRSIPVAHIAEARPVRTTWLEGWGIHYTKFGWLYNVAGFEAVAFTLKDGKKLAVGTDEPQNLIAALKLGLVAT